MIKQKTQTIGMIVPDIANPFFPMVVRGAEDAALKQGYNLLLCNSDDSLAKEESAVELLLSKRVDGILLTKAAGDFSPALRQMIEEVNIPFVLVMRTYPQLTKDAVISDDYQGAYEAVCHLARSGRRRIGLVSGPLKISNAKERFRGFRHALEVNNLPYEPELFCGRGLPHRVGIPGWPRSAFARPGRNLCSESSDDDWAAEGGG